MASSKYYRAILDTLQGQTEELRAVAERVSFRQEAGNTETRTGLALG
jgi:hypothetical protein